jgi:DNA-binding transcriptional ArsR family regulator
MSHRVKLRLPAAPTLDDELAESVAELSQAFATSSRVRILVRLWRSPTSVSVVAQEIGMEPSAVSHQLRLLRHLDLVRASRVGRTIVYSLRDDHVATMLNEAIYHVEHLRLETPDAAQRQPRDPRQSTPRPTNA